MFSGLVSAIGTVRALNRRGGGARLEVACVLPGEPLALGESVAVHGACLTVAGATTGAFEADLSPETLARTTLGALRPGSRVNLERAMRLSDRLGGHLVLGHVDATAAVVSVRPARDYRTVRIALPAALAPEVAEKGSVAVDGVSLTVSRLGGGWFEAALIPATLAGTTLGDVRPGDTANLETDVLAKYVRRVLSGAGPGSVSPMAGFGDAAD
ncbi:MAG TPA: riboflavin synthase [Thermoanaerobaculaceae bacterium]|nr:riboflavin synthase [Thermoanaerobaculaceae bacterium]